MLLTKIWLLKAFCLLALDSAVQLLQQCWSDCNQNCNASSFFAYLHCSHFVSITFYCFDFCYFTIFIILHNGNQSNIIFPQTLQSKIKSNSYYLKIVKIVRTRKYFAEEIFKKTLSQKSVHPNSFAYTGVLNHWLTFNCSITNFSCEEIVIFLTCRK